MKAKVFLSVISRFGVLPVIGLLLSGICANAQVAGAKAPLQQTEEVAVLTKYEVKPEGRKKLQKMLRKYVRRAGANENNVMAEAYYEQENSSVLWVIERWNSKQELDNIKSSARVKKLTALLEKKLVQPAKIIYIKDLEPLSKSTWRRLPEKKDSPLVIMLFVDSKAGTEDQFTAVYHTAMPQFRSEPGVINYQLSRLAEDNTQFVTYEKFRNEDAFQYHLKFPPIQPVIDYLNTSIKKQPFQSGLHRLIPFAVAKG